MPVILNLAPEVERTLAEKAARMGQTLAVYLEQLAERDARGKNGVGQAGSPQPLSSEEWRRCILETAGKWQGEFERPEQGEYEQREPLA
jgi:hypothetical protein